MKKGRIGLAVGLLTISSFAAISQTGTVTVDEPAYTRAINKTVIQDFVRQSDIDLSKVKYSSEKYAIEENTSNTRLARVPEEDSRPVNTYTARDKEILRAVDEEILETKVVAENEEKVEIVSYTASIAPTKPVEKVKTVENEAVHVSSIEEGNTVIESEKEQAPAASETIEQVVAEVKPESTATVQNTEKATEPKLEVESAKVTEEVTVSLAFTGWVQENLNVRNGRSSSTEIIGVLDKGTQVVGKVQDGWVEISYNGTTGYVSESFLSSTEAVLPEEPQTPPVEIPNKDTTVQDNDDAHVQKNEASKDNKPSNSDTAQKPEDSTDKVEKPEADDSKDNTDKSDKPAVEEPAVVKPPAPSGNVVSDIVGAAYSLVGSSYVWAGSSPSVGFDCSGLTSYLYREYAGIELSRITTGQAGNGFGVSKESIAPGDIILFQNDWSDHVDHVGIYVGNGNYIHAATEERGVVLDSASGSYFQNNVVGVRRILN